MLIKKSGDIRYSEITPKSVYMNRRKFLAGVAAATGAATLGARSVSEWLEPAHVLADDTKLGPLVKSPFSTDEMQTPAKDATHYNNYYEFGTDKSDPARNATKFVTSPWSVSVEGEVNKPQKFDIEALRKMAPLEERIYRHRSWKRGQLWFRGSAIRLMSSRKRWTRSRRRNSSPSKAITTSSKCRSDRERGSISLMSKACGSMKR
jgi:DMSO/TMAO reductase YedYZ molybdopterin-dependent catalytic subunit